MIRPEDLKRLGKLNLALCVTPVNMILDINLIDHAVGEKGLSIGFSNAENSVFSLR
jgi:hypothetical protein